MLNIEFKPIEIGLLHTNIVYNYGRMEILIVNRQTDDQPLAFTA